MIFKAVKQAGAPWEAAVAAGVPHCLLEGESILCTLSGSLSQQREVIPSGIPLPAAGPGSSGKPGVLFAPDKRDQSGIHWLLCNAR